MHTYFYELAGNNAKELLAGLEQSLKQLSYVASTRLLKSLDQEELYLLVVEASQTPLQDFPQGLRIWSFSLA